MEVEVVGDLLPRSQALSCTPDKDLVPFDQLPFDQLLFDQLPFDQLPFNYSPI